MFRESRWHCIIMAVHLSFKARTNKSKLLLHFMASKYKCANLISPTRSLPSARAGEGQQVKNVATAILNVILKLRYVNEMHISRYKVYHVYITNQTI